MSNHWSSASNAHAFNFEPSHVAPSVPLGSASPLSASSTCSLQTQAPSLLMARQSTPAVIALSRPLLCPLIMGAKAATLSQGATTSLSRNSAGQLNGPSCVAKAAAWRICCRLGSNCSSSAGGRILQHTVGPTCTLLQMTRATSGWLGGPRAASVYTRTRSLAEGPSWTGVGSNFSQTREVNSRAVGRCGGSAAFAALCSHARPCAPADSRERTACPSAMLLTRTPTAPCA